MKLFCSTRWLLLALLVSFIPATSHAGVFISVAIAPPPLPVMTIDDQPPCPEPGWIWQPGYWAYDYDNGGYYWVPGTWIMAPYEGALWTPGYWGWNAGLYAWHPGYWGPHVGYYGGVNYGFGYFGIGFVGGMWRGHNFEYNTAVWRVNRTVIRNVYEDRNYNRYRIDDRHIAYSGGPGGVRHDPTPDERRADHDRHMAPTAYQRQHAQAARQDRSAYFNNNHGRPAVIAAPRPLTEHGNAGGGMGNGSGQQGRPNDARPNGRNNGGRPMPMNNNPPRQANQQNRGNQAKPQYQGGRDRNVRPAPQQNQNQAQPYQQERTMPQAQPQPRTMPKPQQRPEARPQPRQAPPPQYRPQPQQRQMPQARPAPEARPAPQARPRQEKPQPRDQGRDH